MCNKNYHFILMGISAPESSTKSEQYPYSSSALVSKLKFHLRLLFPLYLLVMVFIHIFLDSVRGDNADH